MKCVADFETTTGENFNIEKEVRVWAFSCIEIGNYDNYVCGNNIDDFMSYISSGWNNHTCYFHNLKFDGEFILYWLGRNGYKEVLDRKDMTEKTYTTLISDTGIFYSIEVCFRRKGRNASKVTFVDSLKLLNFTVDKIGKDFGLKVLKIEKEEEFYNRFREKNHILTEEEKAYIRNDVEVVARAIEKLYEQGMNKMTVASNALKIYKQMLDKRDWNINFPVLDYETDKQIRKAYKGGWTYLAPRYRNKKIKDGIVLDVNSLYPSRMHDCKLPIGQPLPFTGKYKKDNLYDLYVQKIKCQFKLKKGYLPTIQIKNDFRRFRENEYLEESLDMNGRPVEVELTLSNVDLSLFFDHYEVFNIEYLGGFKFKSSSTLFTDYVDYWINVKIESQKSGNKAMRAIAKLMLNSLYGKFALNPEVKSKHVVYDEKEDRIHYTTDKVATIREAIYIPVGCFITAYAREKTIRSAQKVYDRFMYADTDSLHLEELELPKELEIDPYKLGAWKNEFTFDEAKYLRQKCYMEHGHEEDEPMYWKITVAGMPNKLYKQVNIDNFKYNQVYDGKLQHKRVRGGVLLESTTFEIKG